MNARAVEPERQRDAATETEKIRQLRLLEALERESDARQIDLAVRLGVAVGTVNWLLKRLAAKGYVKIRRIGRWRWRYILTPQGMAAKARLTQDYLRYSMSLYRETRRRARQLLAELTAKGYTQLRLEGNPDNDLLDICRLTCLERGLKIVINRADADRLPTLRVVGTELSLEWPKGSL